MAVEKLHAEIDELEASVATLAEEIAERTKAVAELDAAMAKATEIRAAEKERTRRPSRTPRTHRLQWRRPSWF